jgi:AbiV family abortive infection protein
MNQIYRRLALASYYNAVDLLRDSKILFEEKKFPRAYALLVLSAEELVKSVTYKNISVGITKPEDLQVKEKRTTILKIHESKQRLAFKGLFLSQIFHDNLDLAQRAIRGESVSESLWNTRKADKLESIFAGIEIRKQDALYVRKQKKRIITPNSVIKYEMCKEFLDYYEPTIKGLWIIIQLEDKIYKGLMDRKPASIMPDRFKQY